MFRTSGGARYIGTCYGQWRRGQAEERAETGRARVDVGGVVGGRWWQGMCAASWPVSLVWARFGGGHRHKVVPAGGVAPDPSAPFAARGRPKYPPRGGGAGCPLRVRLRDIMGGSPLKRTWCRFFYGPVWYQGFRGHIGVDYKVYTMVDYM